MCVDEMNEAIEFQQESGSDVTKGALALARVFARSVDKVNKKIEHNSAYCAERWEEIKKSNDELKQHISTIEANFDQKLTALNKKFDNYVKETSFSKAIGDLFLAMFRTPKRCIITLVTFSVIVGAANLKDIIDLLKMLAS